MLDWLIRNWGNLASLVGLALTVFVLFVSKRAEQAAKDAKKAIERKSVAEDLRSCIDDVNLINLFCDSGKWDVSSFIGNRLTQKLTFISNRWASHFADETQEALNLLLTQLDTLNAQLRKFMTRPPKTTELESLVSAILRINKLLAAQVGRYESQVEE
jgi:hypothetical protein